MSSNGSPPVIQRPIPRRPFATGPATAPDVYHAKNLPQHEQNQIKTRAERAQFLDSQSSADTDNSPTPVSSDSISRTQSILNLTSSTLFGIFSPASTSRTSIVGGSGGVLGSSTPWATGAESPTCELLAEQPEIDGDENTMAATAEEIDEVRKASKSLMMLQRQRMQGQRFGAGVGADIDADHTAERATGSAPAVASVKSQALAALFVVARAALLFTFGMGYGVLVSRLRSETLITFDDFGQPTPSQVEAGSVPAYVASYDWRYLVSWGVSGVALGTLLPWFDGVWDRAFGNSGGMLVKARTAPETDWALVVRGIGAFAGVAFAMRKLPWTSTMQASLTLALANPFLWYLLDRSKSGLLLAAVIGFVGSGALMALDLDLTPNPGTHPWPYYEDTRMTGFSGSSAASHRNDSSRGAMSGSSSSATRKLTAETAVWMLSVLFCSCVCFGNIGRRLALWQSGIEQPHI
ncbi:hypothetical protein SEPCBS57363_002739 [Sporothrix epigloea]|uniref:Insig domain containing protein n=1 Tax=Sporothrix epigloea TaxID=1892477 RepID=A0ABP0DKW6_9PEZI